MKKILPECTFTPEQLNNIADLASRTGLCVQTVKILYGRGINDAEKIDSFLHPSKEHFIPPLKMSGMREAVRLITRARDEGWQVVVYGDYDADGICASSIMRGVLADFGIEAVVYVPERTTGYGLSTAAIDGIFEECFPQLFITVDCGISNAEEVEYIKEQGAEVIVTDHHELPAVLPDCICINPKIADGYPYDNLCGAGVAFKVGCALIGEEAYKYLDYAAIATVADSVPLVGENRDIVAEGLRIINGAGDKPYSSFIARHDEPVSAQTIAFSVAPKINAAGRMGDAGAALRLFCSKNANEIFELSARLTAYNAERQKCCDELYASAKSKLGEEGALGRVIMLRDESWNTGFVGIVAARLAEEYARPALLFVKNGDMLKGSARSVESVNIFEALKACEHLISEFGGHSQAAGVNVSEDNFEALKSALNAYLDANCPADAFTPTLYVSGELTGQASQKFAKELELLEPFGVGFKRPMFTVTVGACQIKPVKPLSPHLSLKSPYLDMMYFNGAGNSRILCSDIPKKLIFEYNVSSFRGKEYIKGFVRDVVYDGGNASAARQSIAANDVLLASLPPVECTRLPLSHDDAQREIDCCPVYGTLFVAFDSATLAAYDLGSITDINVFTLSNRNISSCVLVSPQSDCDLSGYSRIIFLDCPPVVTLPSLAGKEVYVCADTDGFACLGGLDVSRTALLGTFRLLAANSYNIQGADAEEAAFRNSVADDPVQALFALKVFEQLGLISFEGGKLTVYRGVRTELSSSPLYRLISAHGEEGRG